MASHNNYKLLEPRSKWCGNWWIRTICICIKQLAEWHPKVIQNLYYTVSKSCIFIFKISAYSLHSQKYTAHEKKLLNFAIQQPFFSTKQYIKIKMKLLYSWSAENHKTCEFILLYWPLKDLLTSSYCKHKICTVLFPTQHLCRHFQACEPVYPSVSQSLGALDPGNFSLFSPSF